VTEQERFRDLLAGLNVKLPLALSKLDIGVILDADGRDVITIDVNGERPDREVTSIALTVTLAINSWGGALPRDA
jgi:hypothetical protein